MANIFVFGDSISFGDWDEKGGWVDRLRRYCIKRCIKTNFREYYEVYNLGRSGDTSEHVLKRFPGEMKARYWKDPITVIIFAFGTNDSILEKGKLWVTEDKFRENVKKLIENAVEFTDKIIFVGPPPVDDNLVDPMPWEKELSYKNVLIKKYSDMLSEICKTNDCKFINIYAEFAKKDYKKLLADGAHPNSKGHKLICDEVRSYLVKKNYIKAV